MTEPRTTKHQHLQPPLVTANKTHTMPKDTPPTSNNTRGNPYTRMRTHAAGCCPQMNPCTSCITAHTNYSDWPAADTNNEVYNYYCNYGITLPVRSPLIFTYQVCCQLGHTYPISTHTPYTITAIIAKMTILCNLSASSCLTQMDSSSSTSCGPPSLTTSPCQ
jgi:hypothetical protein